MLIIFYCYWVCVWSSQSMKVLTKWTLLDHQDSSCLWPLGLLFLRYYPIAISNNNRLNFKKKQEKKEKRRKLYEHQQEKQSDLKCINQLYTNSPPSYFECFPYSPRICLMFWHLESLPQFSSQIQFVRSHQIVCVSLDSAVNKFSVKNYFNSR